MGNPSPDKWDRLLKGIEAVFKKIGFIGGSLVFIIMLALLREVIGRYFFNSPSDWAIDLSGLLYVSLVYIGAGHATLINAHVRTDILYMKFRGKTKDVIDIIIYVVCIFYTAVLLWQSWIMAWDSLVTGELTPGAVRWHIFPFKFAVPFGCLCAIVGFMMKIFQNARSYQRGGGRA